MPLSVASMVRNKRVRRMVLYDFFFCCTTDVFGMMKCVLRSSFFSSCSVLFFFVGCSVMCCSDFFLSFIFLSVSLSAQRVSMCWRRSARRCSRYSCLLKGSGCFCFLVGFGGFFLRWRSVKKSTMIPRITNSAVMVV